MQKFKIETVADGAEFFDRDYWENGPASGKSGYAKWGINRGWDDKFVRHFDMAVPIKGKKVLDVGCALGGIVLALAAAGAEPSGIDLSSYAIQKGWDLYPVLTRMTFIESTDDIHFPHESFDVIHSNQVFEHVPETVVPRMLQEIKRVMKPGAIAWIGLVLGTERGTDDKDPSHITIKPIQWWAERIAEVGLIMDMSIDMAFRATKLQFFDEYGWHSFSFRKGE